jgi:hypothetical protein
MSIKNQQRRSNSSKERGFGKQMQEQPSALILKDFREEVEPPCQGSALTN